MNKQITTFQLCCGALMTAVICIMTMVIQIPIPLGYAHLGDAFILLTVAFLGRREGVWAGGIGSALADLLTGYTQWVIPTFFIKAILALIAGMIMFDCKGNFRLFSPRNVLAAVLGMAWMVIGYVAVGAVLYGSVAAGLASGPGLIVKAIFNIAVYFVVAGVFEKAHVRRLIHAS
ncbi:MAG: ECF transporter S component [Clostridiales bacterium]|nr:ECF transporter S component [Clostridiales bacterium]